MNPNIIIGATVILPLGIAVLTWVTTPELKKKEQKNG